MHKNKNGFSGEENWGALNANVINIKSIALAFVMLLLGLFVQLAGSGEAQAATQWQDIASRITLDVSNPIRSRRSPDAVVNVTVTNSSATVLNAPLRLVLGEFTPADGSVSLQGASGTTDAGETYLDLGAYVGTALAPGASTGTIILTILGGGPVNFSFFPRVEQGIEIPDIAVNITDPATLITVGSTPLQVSGTISPIDATLTVNGAQVNHSNGQFSAAVALEEGSNTIVARAVGANGGEVTDSIVVSMDLTPPYITVETPEDGQVVNTDTIMVSGLVNDIVRGTIADNQANVTVNGLPASVSNRSYLAENVPLVEGDNQIVISASDQVGNSASHTLSVRYEIPGAKRIELVSGQNQRAQIQTNITAPLVAQLIGSDGNPVAGKNVVFRVVQGDGKVGVGTADESQAVLVASDANGQAQTSFKLGSRAGNGNHRVRAKAVGFEGEVIFYATADPNPGDKISVIAGNNQRGAVNQPLPEPFVVAVTDTGSNLIENAQVQFDVVKGGGRFQNGATTFTTTTDTDGRASAQLTLGPDAGLDQQQVTAILVGTEAKAGFTASALQAGDPGQTTITGVVLDNQDNPVSGVTIRVEGTTREGVADAQGQFTITEVPVGPVHLLADGSTATVPGEWPTLSYNIVTVAGASNPLSAPIYMVKLNTERAQWVGAEDVEFLVPEIPGFKLNVKAGSVTFPDGSKEGLLSVTPVNANKIPMAPPNGMQPQLIVTIQPTGTKFDPPAALSLPNVDAYAPGAQVEMYSYDHDLEEFVTIGLGTVSADGSVVASNNGVGVIKAGWHCGSSPSGSGCANGCGYCYDCGENCSCNFVPSRVAQNQSPTDCRTTKCDGSWDPANEDPGECKKCANGNPENDDDGTACDDGLYCTSADGTAPGPDECTNGVCKGTKIDAKILDAGGKVSLGGVNQLLSSVSNAMHLNLPNLSGSVTIGKKKEECCEDKKSMTLIEEAGGTLSLASEKAEVLISIPPYGGSYYGEFLGANLSFEYGVFVGISANVAVNLTRRKTECNDDVEWSGNGVATIGLTLGVKAVSTSNVLGSDCGFSGDQDCKVIELSASATGAVTPVITVTSTEIKSGGAFTGIVGTATATMFEGQWFGFTASRSIQIVQPTTFGTTVFLLPAI